MTDHMVWAGLLAIALALFFGFSNGFNDSANQVATVISARALEPEIALSLAAVADFMGAYFLGTSVAHTIGKGILRPDLIQGSSLGVYVISSALLGAITWNVTAWHFGMPASSSHALMGGLLGAFISGFGTRFVQWDNVKAIILVMILSPLLGFFITYLFTKCTFFFAQWFSPKINFHFRSFQVLSLVGQSMAHGTNDAQQTMGVITFMLILMNWISPSQAGEFIVPHWVVLSCSSAIALGVASGGWKVIRRLGSGFYRVRPVHGFAAQSASAGIMYAAASFGFPVSTTQVISTSILGAGAAFRPRSVRWQVAGDMLVAWLITIPVSALIAAVIFQLVRFFAT